MTRNKFLLLSLTVFLAACSKIVEPTFQSIDNVKVISMDMDSVRVGFGITYFNPNNFSVTVKETEANVYVNGLLLGKFRQADPIEVGQNVDFTVGLEGAVPLTNFVQLKLRDLGKKDVVLKADGFTKVGKAGIFISRKILYEGRHRLDQVRF